MFVVWINDNICDTICCVNEDDRLKAHCEACRIDCVPIKHEQRCLYSQTVLSMIAQS